jgi:hypothetical protein
LFCRLHPEQCSRNTGLFIFLLTSNLPMSSHRSLNKSKVLNEVSKIWICGLPCNLCLCNLISLQLSSLCCWLSLFMIVMLCKVSVNNKLWILNHCFLRNFRIRFPWDWGYIFLKRWIYSLFVCFY